MAEKLALHGFEGGDLAQNGYCPIAVWLVVEYYAYESVRGKTECAKAIAKVFGALGVKAAFSMSLPEPPKVLGLYDELADDLKAIDRLKDGKVRRAALNAIRDALAPTRSSKPVASEGGSLDKKQLYLLNAVKKAKGPVDSRSLQKRSYRLKDRSMRMSAAEVDEVLTSLSEAGLITYDAKSRTATKK